MQGRGNGRAITPVTSEFARHTDDGEPESPKTAVDPTGIPETVCPPIQHDPQPAVIREDASQLGVSGGFVARDYDEPPADGLAPAPCPLARRRYRGSRHSRRLTMSRWISSDTAA